MKNLPTKSLVVTLVAGAGLLTGCGGDSNSSNRSVSQNFIPVNSTAIVQTVSSDGSGSDVQLVDLSQDTLAASSGVAAKALTDFIVRTNGTELYQIGRHSIDTITKFQVDNMSQPLYEYGVKDSPEQDTVNLQDMVFVSDTKAYLIPYGSTSVWIVNPQVEAEADFKLGELDLSAYADADGLPEAVSGVVVDGKLFIALQRLNRNNNWTPAEPDVPAYVAVFDTATDLEIDTNTLDDPSNLKGIELETRNPRALSYVSGVGLFLVASGDTYGGFYSRDPGFNGGITTINTDDYSTTLLIDDGSDAEGDQPYGYIINMTVLNADAGYFIGAPGYQNDTLYHFNPTTGEVTGAVLGFEGVATGALTTGPSGNAWLGLYDPMDPRIVVLSADQQSLATVELMQNPSDIAFTQED